MAKQRKQQIQPQTRATEPVIVDRTITDFLSRDYKDYAIYVIRERAIPSMIDGFKGGARKILHTAMTGKLRNGAIDKMPTLIGEVLPIYHHGPSSLEGTIITLSQSFKDNLTPLEIVGQSGSLRDPKAVGAPRYLSIRLSKYAKLIYGKDHELLEHVVDEGHEMEPEFYLPIIPTVLTANTSGLAIGYSFGSFSYDPIDLIDACRSYIVDGQITNEVRPYVKGIKKNAWRFVNERWESHGEIEINERAGTVTVTDLPHSTTFEAFEGHLNNCIDNGEIIEWINESMDDSIRYVIYYKKDDLKWRIEKGFPHHPYRHLYMYARIDKDNLTVLDQNDRVVTFPNKEDLIRSFVDYRLTRYHDRKTHMAEKLRQKIARNEDLINFIKAVIDGKLVLNNRPMDQVKADIAKLSLTEAGLDLKVSKLTKDEYEKLIRDNEELRAELDYIIKTPPTDMYIKELDELREQLIGDFQ